MKTVEEVRQAIIERSNENVDKIVSDIERAINNYEGMADKIEILVRINSNLVLNDYIVEKTREFIGKCGWNLTYYDNDDDDIVYQITPKEQL